MRYSNLSRDGLSGTDQRVLEGGSKHFRSTADAPKDGNKCGDEVSSVSGTCTAIQPTIKYSVRQNRQMNTLRNIVRSSGSQKTAIVQVALCVMRCTM